VARRIFVRKQFIFTSFPLLPSDRLALGLRTGVTHLLRVQDDAFG
jgi:hypothetical protein